MKRIPILALFLGGCVVATGPAAPTAPEDENLTIDTAAPTAIGATIDGTVHASHARYYAIDLHAGDTLAVDARAQVMEAPPGNLEYDLALVDAGDARVASSSLTPSNARDPEWDPYTWSAKVAADGRYYLRVHDDNVAGGKTLRYHLALSLQ